MPPEIAYKMLIQSFGYSLVEGEDNTFIASKENEQIASNSLKALSEIISMKENIRHRIEQEQREKNDFSGDYDEDMGFKPIQKSINLNERKVKMLEYFKYTYEKEKNSYVKNFKMLTCDFLHELSETKMFDHLSKLDRR